MSTRRDDAAELDAHLRAALRHAPDRDTAAPAQLSEQILSAARRSVQPMHEGPAWPRHVRAALASALDALTRPAGAAAFASLVLATVIGVMWHEGDPTEVLPERLRRPDAAPRARSDTPAPAPTAPATLQTPAEPASQAQTAAPDRATADTGTAKATTESKRRNATAQSADARPAERPRTTPAPDATTATADATDTFARAETRPKAAAKAPPSAVERAAAPPQASPATAGAQRSEARATAQESAMPATPPPPPAARAAPPAPAMAPAPATAAAPPTPAPAAPQATAPGGASVGAAAAPRVAPMGAAPPSLRSSLAATPDPITSVVLALGREAASAPSATTHRWQRGNGNALPHGPAAQAWLAELQRATQGAWQPQQGTAAAGADALVLSNERGLVARVELTDAGVRWHSAATPNLSWSATLPDETLKRLRENLAAWAGR